MELDRLLPPGGPIDPVALLAEALPRDGHGDRPYAVANMVSSLDGVAAVDGGSTGLGGAADKAMFGALRGAVDAVLAGTATVAAEGYGRLARAPERRAQRAAAGLAEDPLMVLITRSGSVPFDAPLFAAPEQPVVIACPPGAVTVPDVAAPVTLLELDDLTNAAALRAVQELGVRTLLCEGGPRLLRALVAEGLLDELFLTLHPGLVAGDDQRRILAGEAFETPRDVRLAGILRGGDELLLRYRL